MKFLIAGLGSIGRRHLRHLAALGQTDITLYRTGRSTLPDEDLKAILAYLKTLKPISNQVPQPVPPPGM